MSIIALLQQQARRQASSPLQAALDRALSRARSRIGDPYVWGGKQPGAFDCSGFVSWAYEGAVPSFTDAIYGSTGPAQSSLPGDIVLYEYHDMSQPGVRFPHVGLWLDEWTTLDCRFPEGCGVHPHVVGAVRHLRRVPGLDDAPVGYFTPEQIAAILGSPVANVRVQWPLVLSALKEFGIDDRDTQVAALATIGVEVEGIFLPVEEGYYYGAGAAAYQRTLSYYPYFGRGLVQLTHLTNYARAERELGITGLVNNPDLALDPRNSARILAWYFATHGGGPLIPQAARIGAWRRVRELVNGGDTGLADFLGYVQGLQQVVGGG